MSSEFFIVPCEAVRIFLMLIESFHIVLCVLCNANL